MTQMAFVVSLAGLWVGILYMTMLALAGYRFHEGWRRQLARGSEPVELPGVSILIPAHDEERVIELTLRAFLALDYPPDRLEIVVIDDASTDATGELCDRLAATDPRLRVVHTPPQEGGRGKAAALNRGLAQCRHPYVAVYDADNRPDPAAIRRLVGRLEERRATPGGQVYVGAVGRLRKLNRTKTMLNRFCAFEWAAFQWTFQAGRSRLFDLVSIPGTHFLLRADVVRAVGGWDVSALTEDTELSVRLHGAGLRLLFVPEAVSEEQDPERLSAWLRQRQRWVVGNYYVLYRHLWPSLRARRWRALLDLASLTLAYLFFLVTVLVSNGLFLAGAVGLIRIEAPGPFGVLWGLAATLFVGTILLTQALEEEDGWRTPALATLMYVSYVQLWLYVAVRGAFVFASTRGRMTWVKTPRFED